MLSFLRKTTLLLVVLTLSLGFSSANALAAKKSQAEWILYGEQDSLLTAAQNTVFQKGISTLSNKNASYHPVMLLASQKADGTNYVFLSLRFPKSATSSISWAVVTVKKKQDGKFAVLAADTINISSIKTLSKSKKNAKWTYNTASYKKKTSQPAYARKAYKKALKKYKGGVKLKAVTFFAKKKQNGYYYKALCVGKKNKVSDFYIVDVFKSAKKGCKIISCKAFDLSSYLKIPASTAQKATVATKTAAAAPTVSVSTAPAETALPLTVTQTTISSSEKSLRDRIVKAALSYVGKTPYVAAGNSLINGTDCSGFVHLIYAKFGLKAPRSSSDYLSIRNITYEELQPGDIVVYEHHVAIYIGNDQIVHAKGSSYGTVKDTMWYKRPHGYARLIK